MTSFQVPGWGYVLMAVGFAAFIALLIVAHRFLPLVLWRILLGLTCLGLLYFCAVEVPIIKVDDIEESMLWADIVRTPRMNVPIRHALSNSFGFGGTNAAIIVSREDA